MIDQSIINHLAGSCLDRRRRGERICSKGRQLMVLRDDRTHPGVGTASQFSSLRGIEIIGLVRGKVLMLAIEYALEVHAFQLRQLLAEAGEERSKRFLRTDEYPPCDASNGLASPGHPVAVEPK